MKSTQTVLETARERLEFEGGLDPQIKQNRRLTWVPQKIENPLQQSNNGSESIKQFNPFSDEDYNLKKHSKSFVLGSRKRPKEFKLNNHFMSQQSFLSKNLNSDRLKVDKSEKLTIDIKDFTIQKYEEHLEKILLAKGIHSHQKTDIQITELEPQKKMKFKRYVHKLKFGQNRNVLLNLKTRPFQRKAGYQEIPRILIDQSNKHLRNKLILSKFIDPPHKKSLKELFKNDKYGSNEINDELESDEDQEEIIQESHKNDVKKSCLTIYPDSTMRAIWDISLFFFIVYQSIMLPMRISFEMTSSDFIYYLELSIDVSFLVDILINFNTGIYSHGQLIMSRAMIFQDYIAFWFWVDLLSSLPYTWFLAWSQGVPIREIESDDQMQNEDSNLSGVMSNTPQFLRLLKIAKLLKMLKLLRVVKIKRILQKFDDYIVTDQMNLLVTFFNLTIKIIIVAHYMGCFFFFYGMKELRENNSGWLINSDMIDLDFKSQFITSIYWAMVTMAGVGYGEILPITKNERQYAMMVMIITSGIFAYTVNSIGTIVSEYSSTSASYREKMMYVNKYMIEKEMPYDLRMKIRRYLDYVFESKKEIKIDEQDVHSMLNENLNDKLQMYLKGQMLKKINFIQDFGIDFMTELTNHFKKVTFVSDDFLFMEKDKAECIYFIIQGKVAMIHKQTHTFITDVVHDEYFGELGCLNSEPRQLSAKSRDFTEVYTIFKDDFESITENYIEAITVVKKIQTSLENNNYLPLKTECYICRAKDHLALRCPKFSKYRGNLLKMQVAPKQKSFFIKDFKEEKVDDEIQEQKVFVYQDENFQKLHYPSMESDEEYKMKVHLIRKNVKEGQELLDGHMINRILTEPRNVQKEFSRKNKRNFMKRRDKSSKNVLEIVDMKTKIEARKTIRSEEKIPNKKSRVRQNEKQYKLTNIIEDEKEGLSLADEESIKGLKKNEIASGALPENNLNLSQEAINKCQTLPINEIDLISITKRQKKEDFINDAQQDTLPSMFQPSNPSIIEQCIKKDNSLDLIIKKQDSYGIKSNKSNIPKKILEPKIRHTDHCLQKRRLDTIYSINEDGNQSRRKRAKKNSEEKKRCAQIAKAYLPQKSITKRRSSTYIKFKKESRDYYGGHSQASRFQQSNMGSSNYRSPKRSMNSKSRGATSSQLGHETVNLFTISAKNEYRPKLGVNESNCEISSNSKINESIIPIQAEDWGHKSSINQDDVKSA